MASVEINQYMENCITTVGAARICKLKYCEFLELTGKSAVVTSRALEPRQSPWNWILHWSPYFANVRIHKNCKTKQIVRMEGN